MALPEILPILGGRRRDGGGPAYVEPEITTPVDLCDTEGRLNPAAIGWARTPIIRGNLRGSWPRKKRWNFWNWISPEFLFSVTLADIDYAAFCQVTCIDFATGGSVGNVTPAWPGSIVLPEHVAATVRFDRGGISYTNVQNDGVMHVNFTGRAKSGEPIRADFVVRTPAHHESLTVVVPWSSTRFQLNSKHAALPCEGTVTVGDRHYTMRPETCHAVQDFGRGIWPYRAFWNWGVATGVHDGVPFAVNVGARWTTGTGSNENAILFDGRLHKIMEDLCWDYDPGNWMRPWRVRAEHSEVLDLVLEPIHVHRVRTSIGVLSTGGVCCFGRWHGTVRVDGRVLQIRDCMGWVEEFAHRW